MDPVNVEGGEFTNKNSSRFKDATFYYLVPPPDIGYVGFVIHGYEGLAMARTVDGSLGLVEIITPPDMVRDLKEVMTGLSEEIEVREVTLEQVLDWGYKVVNGALVSPGEATRKY